MNPPPRTPVVLGVGPRTGTSTTAAALHAHDGGVRDLAADVVVCAGTEESLRRAETVAVTGTRPLLAVVLLDGGPPPARSRLRLAGLRYAAVAVLPHVPAWSGSGRPADGIATLLGQHPEHLPPAHRAYAAALRTVTAGLLGTGLLDNPRPPTVVVPLPGRTLAAPVLVPVAPRPAPLRPPIRPPGRRHDPAARHDPALDDLDDEALEYAVALLGTR